VGDPSVGLSGERTSAGGGDAPAAWALSEGDTLGGYRVVRPLGRGGMGEVYLVENVQTDMLYALKLLPSSLAQDSKFRERFRREARVMASLDHPAIVHVTHVAEEAGRWFLVMDYVEGAEGSPRTLADEMRSSGPLPGEKVGRYVQALMGAVSYAHSAGVIHRDLKPANVLLDKAGQVHLADFGLIRIVGDEFLETKMQRSLSLSLDKTTGGERLSQSDHAVIGTYAYMSPEQKAGVPADERSDIYSLGLILYEMLTGEKAEGAWEAPSALGHIAAWDAIVRKALAPKPGKRYASVEELADDVKKAPSRYADMIALGLERSGSTEEELRNYINKWGEQAYLAALAAPDEDELTDDEGRFGDDQEYQDTTRPAQGDSEFDSDLAGQDEQVPEVEWWRGEQVRKWLEGEEGRRHAREEAEADVAPASEGVDQDELTTQGAEEQDGSVWAAIGAKRSALKHQLDLLSSVEGLVGDMPRVYRFRRLAARLLPDYFDPVTGPKLITATREALKATCEDIEAAERAERDHDAAAAMACLEKAETKLDQLNVAVARAQGSSDFYLDRGMARSAGDRAGADRDFEKAIGLGAKSDIAYLRRGMSLFDARDFEEAIRHFGAAIELSPRNPVPYHGRGRARMAQGDVDGAVQDFSSASELDPEASVHCEALRQARLARGGSDSGERDGEEEETQASWKDFLPVLFVDDDLTLVGTFILVLVSAIVLGFLSWLGGLLGFL